MMFQFLLSHLLIGVVVVVAVPDSDSAAKDASKDLSSTASAAASAASLAATANRREGSATQFFSFSPDELTRRELQWTGDIWKACSGDREDGKFVVSQNNTVYTNQIYQHTEYDDAHEPACTCFFDPAEEEYVAQCSVGDGSCSADEGCQGTHEFFLFSDSTGDLRQKSSCRLCQEPNPANCAGKEETCTIVGFDETTGDPTKCFLRQFVPVNGTVVQTQCNACQVCQDSNGDYGLWHSCFGETMEWGTCDTDGIAHLHNFEVVPQPGRPAIGGTFGDLCQVGKAVDDLYRRTSYDDPYQKRCDCPDPTSGVISCDLYTSSNTDGCFANQCTDLSERYFFHATTGAMNAKMTCDLTSTEGDGLCSIVKFYENAKPYFCTMFGPDNLDTCDNCRICQDPTTLEYGIRYDCFGSSVSENDCLTDMGRAVYNMAIPMNLGSDTDSSSGSSTIANNNYDDDAPATGVNRPYRPKAQDNDDEFVIPDLQKRRQRQRGIIAGSVVGGMVSALLLTLCITKCCCTGGNAPTTEPDTDEPPIELVDEAGKARVIT